MLVEKKQFWSPKSNGVGVQWFVLLLVAFHVVNAHLYSPCTEEAKENTEKCTSINISSLATKPCLR
jgi:hypothetical protein